MSRERLEEDLLDGEILEPVLDGLTEEVAMEAIQRQDSERRRQLTDEVCAEAA